MPVKFRLKTVRRVADRNGQSGNTEEWVTYGDLVVKFAELDRGALLQGLSVHHPRNSCNAHTVYTIVDAMVT